MNSRYLKIGIGLLPFFYADTIYKEYKTPIDIVLVDNISLETIKIDDKVRQSINRNDKKINEFTSNERLKSMAVGLCNKLHIKNIMHGIFDDTVRLPIYPIYGLLKLIELHPYYLQNRKREFKYICYEGIKYPILESSKREVSYPSLFGLTQILY